MLVRSQKNKHLKKKSSTPKGYTEVNENR